MAAVDYLYWSPPLEGLASGAGRSGEMWITGKGERDGSGEARRAWLESGANAGCLAQRGHLIYSTRVQV